MPTLTPELTWTIVKVSATRRSWPAYGRRDSDMPYGKTRVYVWPEGENIWENLENRRSRPQTEWRKLLPEVLEQAGLPQAESVRWSQKAGCSCPCSPGYVLTGVPAGYDIHVTVTLA